MISRQKRISPAVGSFAGLGVLVVVLPILALLVRVPWTTLAAELSSPESVLALRVSLVTSLAAAMFSVALGVPVAWLLARGPQSVTALIRPVVMAPIVLPPTVAGLSLLALLGRNGVLGRFIYDATGYAMPFTMIAVILAGVFVGMPFLIMVLETAFVQLDPEIEQAAETDGAHAGQIFWQVSVPQVRHALGTGAALAWARALGEFGATLTFAGSFPGVTRTLPQQVYVALESNLSNAYALSGLLLVISIVMMAILRGNLRNPFVTPQA